MRKFIQKAMIMPRNLGGGGEVASAIVSRTITEYADNNITSVGKYAFRDCSALTTVDFPLVTSIDSNAFYDCAKLTTVNIPQLTSIGSNAFYNCVKLTTVDFPLLTSIGNYAFRSCSVMNAIILRSQTMVAIYNENTFSNCYHLLGTVDSTYNPTGAKDGYIYVPSALVESYKTDYYWSNFATQFRALEDYTVDGTTTGALDESKI